MKVVDPQEEREKERKIRLQETFKRCNEIPLSKLAEILEIEDPVKLEQWLLLLPEEFPMRIKGKNIIIDAEQSNIRDSVDQLIQKLGSREDSNSEKS